MFNYYLKTACIGYHFLLCHCKYFVVFPKICVYLKVNISEIKLFGLLCILCHAAEETDFMIMIFIFAEQKYIQNDQLLQCFVCNFLVYFE